MSDLNGESQTGFSLSHGTLRDGLRCSAAKAFLRSINDRENLHVTVNTMVEKILIDEENMQAYAVDLNKLGIEKTIYAAKEIILSAGAIQTPQLLMLSGIGPREHLEEIGFLVGRERYFRKVTIVL